MAQGGFLVGEACHHAVASVACCGRPMGSLCFRNELSDISNAAWCSRRRCCETLMKYCLQIALTMRGNTANAVDNSDCVLTIDGQHASPPNARSQYSTTTEWSNPFSSASSSEHTVVSSSKPERLEYCDASGHSFGTESPIILLGSSFRPGAA